jgi:hypothetical protein
MNFVAALTAMLNGKRLQRPRWVGYGEYVRILAISCYEPCIVMQTERGTERPGWTPSSEDLFAGDWQVVT